MNLREVCKRSSAVDDALRYLEAAKELNVQSADDLFYLKELINQEREARSAFFRSKKCVKCVLTTIRYDSALKTVRELREEMQRKAGLKQK